MNRFFLIFSKDLRHFWKEVLLSWCLLALYVYSTTEESPIADTTFAVGFFAFASLSYIVVPLLLSWCLLLVRVVQDERLVGDRQFWVTRPYRWPELLAEKIFFLLVFISLPLGIAQVAILKLAGFSALPYLGGLLVIHLQLLAFGAGVFIAAIVTATLAQVILVALIVLLYGVVSSAVIGMIPNSSMNRADSLIDLLGSLAAVGSLIAVVLIQYAQRRTALSRGILGGLAVLTIVLGVITPYAKLIAKQYPAVNGAAAPVVIALDTRKPEIQPSVYWSPRRLRSPKPEEHARLHILFLTSTVNSDEIAHFEGDRVRVYLPNGRTWQSSWQGQVLSVMGSQRETPAHFALPLQIFDLAKSTAVKVDIEWALSVYRRGESWRVVATDGVFAAPRLGLCAVYPGEMVLHCRSPLYASGPLLATISAVDSTCPSVDKSAPTGYYENFSRREPEPGINPMVEEQIVFNASRPQFTQDRRLSSRICPGTPINFSALDFVRRVSTVTTLEDVHLSDYREREAQFTVLDRP